MGGRIINSSIYHPRTNGQIERPNHTIKMILKSQDKNHRWTDCFEKSIWLYNRRKHSTTKYSPFIVEGFLPENEMKPLSELKKVPAVDLQRIHNEVAANIKSRAFQRERRHNHSLKSRKFEIGDLVVARLGKKRKITNEPSFPFRGYVHSLSSDGFSVKLEWLIPPGGMEVGSISNMLAYENVKLVQKNAKTLGIDTLFAESLIESIDQREEACEEVTNYEGIENDSSEVENDSSEVEIHLLPHSDDFDNSPPQRESVSKKKKVIKNPEKSKKKKKIITSESETKSTGRRTRSRTTNERETSGIILKI